MIDQKHKCPKEIAHFCTVCDPCKGKGNEIGCNVDRQKVPRFQ